MSMVGIGMDIDSPPLTPRNPPLSPKDRIVKKLIRHGVPEDLLMQLERGLVVFAANKKQELLGLISAVLPTEEDLLESQQTLILEESNDASSKRLVEDLCRESLRWVQWLMFQCDPGDALKKLESSCTSAGVCGTVWGRDDIAYRCRTCEHDPTCAICVPCFQNGNHKDHDFSIIKTGGGCCDCGDITAWKRQGFCSRHKGQEQVKPLDSELATSIEPVLDAVLLIWKGKLSRLSAVPPISGRGHDHLRSELADGLSSAIAEIFFEFSGCSESLLKFIAARMYSSSDLLEVIVRAERFLSKDVAGKLNELILKLLSEPTFKYEFAKVFISHYSDVLEEAMSETGEGNYVDTVSDNYPLLSSLSVQIFTVPTLTPRLVKENNLLGILFDCLRKLLLSLVNDGQLLINRLMVQRELALRFVEQARYVMSHLEVAKYASVEHQDIFGAWLRIQLIAQGMDPQKRVSSLNPEDENENWTVSFLLEQLMGSLHPLFVAGAFSTADTDDMKDEALFYAALHNRDDEWFRHSKVGKLSEENLPFSLVEKKSSGNMSSETSYNSPKGLSLVPSTVANLMSECLKTIDTWLGSHLMLRTHKDTKDDDNAGHHASTKRIEKFRTGSSTPIQPSIANERGHVPRGVRVSGIRARESLLRLRSGLSVQNSTDSGNLSTENHSLSCSRNIGMLGDTADAHAGSRSLRILGLSEWPQVYWDIISHDVSIHIPLHRLFSLFLCKTIERHNRKHGLLGISNSSSIASFRDIADFVHQMLEGCHPYGFSAALLEHPLRIKIFCSQVRAGMWRKNGHSVHALCESYHSVRWYEQGLELDLFLLQFCAALAPPESFVERIVERYGLSEYISLNPNAFDEYEPFLVQDMLTLIIQIIKERQLCGMSTTERLKRELICKLAVGNATHSQLLNALPRSLSGNDQLQQIIDTIAVYANPSGMKQGKYSLRKPYWKELDLYHPRWSSRDLQVAEDRYLRFCKIPAMTTQLPCWTRIFHPLSNLSRIATSKTSLQIVRAVIYYAVSSENPSASRAPDGVLLRALHLIALGLDICSLNHPSSSNFGQIPGAVSTLAGSDSCDELSFPLLRCATETIEVGGISKHMEQEHHSLLSLLVLLMIKLRRNHEVNEEGFFESGHGNISLLIENLLRKFGDLDACCLAELGNLVPEMRFHSDNLPESGAHPLESPDGDKRKAKIRERQAAIMEKMKEAQTKFLATVGSAPADDSPVSNPKRESSSDDELHSGDSAIICSLCRESQKNKPVSYLILLQISRLTSFTQKPPPSWVENDGDSSSNAGVSEPLIQNSGSCKFRGTETRNGPRDDSGDLELPESAFRDMEEDSSHYPQLRRFSVPLTGGSPTAGGDDGSTLPGHYMQCLLQWMSALLPLDANLSSHSQTHMTHSDGLVSAEFNGVHVSSCGHAVHRECWDRYLVSVKQRHNSRTVFEGAQVVDPEQGEFLCPVCRRLANSILPAVLNGPKESEKKHHLTCLHPGVSSPSSSPLRTNNLKIGPAVYLLQKHADLVGRSGHEALYGHANVSVRSGVQPLLHTICKMFGRRGSMLLSSGWTNFSLLLWDMFKYTLVSTEIASRHGKRDSDSRLEALYGEVRSTTGFMLSLLLKIAHANHSQDELHIFLRASGLKMLSWSICSGISLNEFSNGGMSLDQHLEEHRFPDIQFWKRTADPVLLRDPFSSLMWVLFCLPFSSISAVECFIPLVHLFYVVSVVQALITCGRYGIDFSQLSHEHHLVVTIQKVMGVAAAGQKYFMSNFIDDSRPAAIIIKRLTLPYLRRCALLWKLLKSSTPPPFSGGIHSLEGARWNNNVEKMTDNTYDVSVEIEETDELQKLFGIPPVAIIFEDETVKSLAVKWCEHFQAGLGVRNYTYIYSSPAVPFQLMHLPQVYHELLERYIKRRCPECDAPLDQPALCLLCGRLCAPRRYSCCRESECEYHTMSCTSGIGVYLLIKRTTILLQRLARQSPWPSPYLDAFGEEDVELVRGRPLYLNKERYATLTYLVVSHGLDRSSEVLRQAAIEPVIFDL